jgi:hypothetical protein
METWSDGEKGRDRAPPDTAHVAHTCSHGRHIHNSYFIALGYYSPNYVSIKLFPLLPVSQDIGERQPRVDSRVTLARHENDLGVLLLAAVLEVEAEVCN